jgi:hypothetical protein
MELRQNRKSFFDSNISNATEFITKSEEFSTKLDEITGNANTLQRVDDNNFNGEARIMPVDTVYKLSLTFVPNKVVLENSYNCFDNDEHLSEIGMRVIEGLAKSIFEQ